MATAHCQPHLHDGQALGRAVQGAGGRGRAHLAARHVTKVPQERRLPFPRSRRGPEAGRSQLPHARALCKWQHREGSHCAACSVAAPQRQKLAIAGATCFAALTVSARGRGGCGGPSVQRHRSSHCAWQGVQGHAPKRAARLPPRLRARDGVDLTGPSIAGPCSPVLQALSCIPVPVCNPVRRPPPPPPPPPPILSPGPSPRECRRTRRRRAPWPGS